AFKKCKHTLRRKQFNDVAQGGPQVHRRMNTIRGNNDVELLVGKALRIRIALKIQNIKAEERILAELRRTPFCEQRRNVSERVLDTFRRKHASYIRCGSTCTATNLEDADAAVRRQPFQKLGNRLLNKSLEYFGCRGFLVQCFSGIE